MTREVNHIFPFRESDLVEFLHIRRGKHGLGQVFRTEIRPKPRRQSRSIVAANCAYVLPISTRAIPIGHGLDAAEQIKYGLLLTLITLATTITTCTLFMMYSPLFSEL